MSIRYELDTSGPLHKIVKVVDAAPPLFAAPAPVIPSLPLADAAALIRAAAEGLRAGAQRRNRWGYGRPVPNTPDPARDVTGAQLRAARLAVGLSQRELAQQFPYGRGLIASVELGYRSCPLDLGDWAKHVLRNTPKEGRA